MTHMYRPLVVQFIVFLMCVCVYAVPVPPACVCVCFQSAVWIMVDGMHIHHLLLYCHPPLLLSRPLSHSVFSPLSSSLHHSHICLIHVFHSSALFHLFYPFYALSGHSPALPPPSLISSLCLPGCHSIPL